MKEPEFLLVEAIRFAHVRQLQLHGGLSGTRDVGMLESAIARARNIAYEGGTVPRLASAYTFGIVRNHPFVDGNKRTGLVAGVMFLTLNGYDLDVTNAEACAVILRLAAGEVSEEELAEWFTAHARPR